MGDTVEKTLRCSFGGEPSTNADHLVLVVADLRAVTLSSGNSHKEDVKTVRIIFHNDYNSVNGIGVRHEQVEKR